MIILLSLLTTLASALTNFDACETELVLDDRRTMRLRSDQIAFRGPLGEIPLWTTPWWSVVDRQLHTEVQPGPWRSEFALRSGDEVFVLSRSGRVMLEGRYDAFVREGTVYYPGQGRFPRRLRPRLRGQADGAVLRAFTHGSEAVVVRWLAPSDRRDLERTLGPALRRYLDYVPRASRVRFGDTVVDPKVFEKILMGPVRGEWRRDHARVPYLALSLEVDGEWRDLEEDQRLILLDATGRPLADFRVHEAAAHQDVLRSAARGFSLEVTRRAPFGTQKSW